MALKRIRHAFSKYETVCSRFGLDEAKFEILKRQRRRRRGVQRVFGETRRLFISFVSDEAAADKSRRVMALIRSYQ